MLKNLTFKFNHEFSEIINEINYVIIENQLGQTCHRMKEIQALITQYSLLVFTNLLDIQFISASNKLKLFNLKHKTTYDERKKISIIKCKELLISQNQSAQFIDFFDQHLKKDDLADSFLQGYWFIQNSKC